MARIFISYRRDDSRAISGRIHQSLIKAVGERNVFKDVDDIPVGRDFRAVIEKAILGSDILLVVIGPKWLSIADAQGSRRLDNPQDFVRLEIEMALRHGKRVVPLLVGGA